MNITAQILHDSTLIAKGYTLPRFDVEAVRAATAKTPKWVHFGAGNIFRAFLADVAQEMLDQGKTDCGVIAAEGYDGEIIDRTFTGCDNLTLLVILKSDRTVEKRIVASVTEALRADPAVAADWKRLKEIFCSPSLQMASFTITEKGYSLKTSSGYLPAVDADFNAGPDCPVSYIGKIAALLYARYRQGALPLAMVSMDNCSANGDRLRESVLAFAEQWCAKGVVDSNFLIYVRDSGAVTFPWTMIDKITPRPDASVQGLLEDDGFKGLEPVVTGKNTYVAPFVNAEKTQYLVVEDAFPNGRPCMEGTGVYFTDREHVAKVERMKVTTCLNPLHTALAIYGCLMGFTLMSEEMKDPDLKKLVYRLGYDEGLPVVVDPEILDPRQFLTEVVEDRIPNPFLPDTPQRIATDTSQKLSIRLGETVKEYIARGLGTDSLVAVPLVQAGWLRYLLGVDDNGNRFELSPDPMADELRKALSGVELGKPCDCHGVLEQLLSNAAIFGVNLYEAGVGERVEALFAKLIEGPGAVRKTLQEVLE